MNKWNTLRFAVYGACLALQLPFCFEVGSLSDRLMSSTPE
jgi:hypothetical protein